MKKLVVFIIFSSLFSGSCFAQAYDKANPPTNVTAVLQKNEDAFFIITWKAAQNVDGYIILWQMEGSNVIFQQNTTQYRTVDLNTDTYRDTLDLTGREKYNKQFRIGVRSSGKIDNGGKTSGPSDIIWTGYLSLQH